MRLVSFDGVDLDALGVAATIPREFPGFEISPQPMERAGTSPVQAAPRFGLRPIPVDFVVKPNLNIEQTQFKLLQALRPLEGREKRLVALLNDGATEVEQWATVGTWDKGQARNRISVTLYASNPVWRRLSPLTTSQTFTGGSPASMAVTVQGEAPAKVVLRIQPTAQRSGGTASVGIKWRRTLTVTNNGNGTLHRYPVLVDTGLTSTDVGAGRMLASGNDVRLWREGREVARTLLNVNAGTTAKMWFLVESLPIGQSAVYEMVYGNPDAGPPPVLQGKDVPAFELASSTNAKWAYAIQTPSRGLWHVDGRIPPRNVDYNDIPGAWRPTLTLPNPDNPDDFTQSAWTTFGSGSVANFHAARSRADTQAYPNERLADGVTISNPLGITSLRCGFNYANGQSTDVSGSAPVGKLVILGRGAGSEQMTKVFERNQTNNTFVTVPVVTYTPSDDLVELAVAVWPWDEVAVTQLAKKGRFVEAWFSGACEVNIRSGNLSLAWGGAAEAVYEVALEARIGGGAGAAPPYHVLRVGGGPERRLAVRLGEQVVIDAERRTGEVWNASLTNKLADVPVAALEGEDVTMGPGTAVTYPARRWLPLDPGAQTVYVTEPAMGTVDVDVLHTPGYL